MKFKNKIYIQYKYLLIYSWLILQTEAARPFSSGNTRSYYGSGTSNYESTSNIGTTNYNTGLSSQSNKAFISIADSKRALRSGANTAQTLSSINSGFSSSYKSSDLSPPNGSTKHVINIADGKKKFRSGTNTAQNFPLNSQSNKPIIKIADGKENLYSGSKVATNLNTPTKQPAYNPYFNAGPKLQASKNIDGPLIQQTAFGVGNQLPTAPNYDTNTLSKQFVYNPTFNTVPKTQVPNSNDEKLLPKPPAYNTFYKTGTNESPNFTTIKQPPYNPSFHEMNTTQNFPAGLNQQPPNNAEHTSNVKNITKIPGKNGYNSAKIIHNYLKGSKAMLSHTSSILGLKGYTVGAVEQLNHLKTQQELNRALKNHKSNHVRNQIPVIIAVVVIITIVGGIIIFLKVKK